MSRRDVPLLLEDILDAISNFERYVSGLAFEDFLLDEKTMDAVVRNLEIIGEASKRLPNEFKSAHPSMDWPAAVGMRNRMVHDYTRIDYQIVWSTVQETLPEFKTYLAKLL